ncbi:MAG: hypothetical protein LBG12_06520 [Synergistaceae bacterium]|nr:hypothetical protein [Synergistaceae bacterium]
MIRRSIGVVLVFILIASGTYVILKFAAFPVFFRQNPAAVTTRGQAVPSAADAMPGGESGEAYFFMRVSDMETLAGAVSWIDGIGARLETDAYRPLAGKLSSEDIAGAASVISSFSTLLASSENIALYSSSGVDGRDDLFVSIAARNEKLDALISGDFAGFMSDGRYRAVAQNENRWTVRAADGDGNADSLLISRERSGDFSLVCLSDSEESLGRMKAAVSEPSKRLKIYSRTEGENCMRLVMPKPYSVGRTAFTEAEVSWDRDDRHVGFRFFTDAKNLRALRPSSEDSVSAPSIYGTGETAMFLAADPAFFIRAALPNENDPVNYTVEKYTPSLISPLRERLEAVLSDCRITAAANAEGDNLRSAYVSITSGTEDALAELFAFAGLFFVPCAKPDGWDAAYAVPLRQNLEARLAARHGEAALLLGNLAEFERRREAPPDITALMQPGNPLAFRVSDAFFKARPPGAGSSIRENLKSEAAKRGANVILPWIDKIDSLTVTQSADGLTEANAFFRQNAEITK